MGRTKKVTLATLTVLLFLLSGYAFLNQKSNLGAKEIPSSSKKRDLTEEEQTGFQSTTESTTEESPNKESLKIDIYSQYAILIDQEGQVVFEKNSQTEIKPASLTKIMTALVTLERASDLSETIYVDGQLVNQMIEQNASLAGFVPGTYVTIEELLYGLLLPSGGEAAILLANHLAASEADFVKLMNEKAQELGMTQTHFVNAHGIEDPAHVTTVADLAKLLQSAIRNEPFKRITSSPHYQGERYTFESTVFQKFGEPNLKAGRLLGGKTGFTKEAGLCLATYAEIRGRNYVLVTTGAPGDLTTEQLNMVDARHIYDSL